MNLRLRLFRTFPVVIAISFLFTLLACQSDSPVDVEQTVVENSSQVTILKVDDSYGLSVNMMFTARKLINDDGGFVEVGNDYRGHSYLNFPEDAINAQDYPNGVYIGFQWESESLLQADFYPEGLTFDKPVYIRLSYKDADLTGIDEEALGIYYYNDMTGHWELISENVNTSAKYVEGYINHFSRYAIGME